MTTVPASMGEPLREAERIAEKRARLNQYCMNCGDTRGGPVGHETSECQFDSAAAAVQEVLRPGVKLILLRLVQGAQQDNHPLADAVGDTGPYVVQGCVVYSARHLQDAVRTVWKYTPALLEKLEAKRTEATQLQERLDAATARVGVLEGQLATARALHKPERRYVTPGDDESSYDDPEWIAEAWELPVDQVHYFTVCSHCGSIELGTGGRDYRESLWPCKDAVALGLDGGGSDA